MTEPASPFARLTGDPSSAGPRPAEGFFVLPARAFSDRWKEKPTGEVAIGLRLIGDGDLDVARAEAKNRAWEMHDKPADTDGRRDCYQETLMQWVVAFCTCDVNDRSRPYFEAAPDTVPLALNDQGLRRAFDEYERFVIAQSVVEPAATDDELRELAARLDRGGVDALESTRQLRARKWLRFLLDQLREQEPQPDWNAYLRSAMRVGPSEVAPVAADGVS